MSSWQKTSVVYFARKLTFCGVQFLGSRSKWKKEDGEIIVKALLQAKDSMPKSDHSHLLTE